MHDRCHNRSVAWCIHYRSDLVAVVPFAFRQLIVVASPSRSVPTYEKLVSACFFRERILGKKLSFNSCPRLVDLVLGLSYPLFSEIVPRLSNIPERKLVSYARPSSIDHKGHISQRQKSELQDSVHDSIC